MLALEILQRADEGEDVEGEDEEEDEGEDVVEGEDEDEKGTSGRTRGRVMVSGRRAGGSAKATPMMPSLKKKSKNSKNNLAGRQLEINGNSFLTNSILILALTTVSL